SFAVYTDNACSSLASTGAGGQISGQPSSGSVSAGSASSGSVTFQAAGSYWWQASYGGDTNNDGASSVCTSEPLSIGKNSPSLTTLLSESSGKIGDSVSDTANLSASPTHPTAKLSFAVYTDNAC